MNTYPPKLIATILRAHREQLIKNDQLRKLQAQCQKSTLEWNQILEGGRFWDDVNGGYLPEDLVLAARREVVDWVHSEGVYDIVLMQECQDAGMKPLDLIWVDTDKSVDPAHKKIRPKLCAREYKRVQDEEVM